MIKVKCQHLNHSFLTLFKLMIQIYDCDIIFNNAKIEYKLIKGRQRR